MTNSANIVSSVKDWVEYNQLRINLNKTETVFFRPFNKEATKCVTPHLLHTLIESA